MALEWFGGLAAEAPGTDHLEHPHTGRPPQDGIRCQRPAKANFGGTHESKGPIEIIA